MPLFGKAKDQTTNKTENDVRHVNNMKVEDKYELKEILGT